MKFAEVLRPDEGTQFPTTSGMRAAAYDHLSVTVFDTMIAYAEWRAVLGLDPATDRRARGAVLWAARKVLREQNKKVVCDRGVGYRVCRPNEHVIVADGERVRAKRWLRRSLQTVTHVALEALTPTEVAKVMTEQARAAINLAFVTRVGKVKALPPRDQLALPSSTKLVEMMTRAKK